MEISIKKNTYLNIFYFLFLSSLFLIFLGSISKGFAKESWQVTEFLINYQGGFVRRGLLGEILFKLHKSIGVSPYLTILTICFFSYIALIVFFVKSFIKNGYTLFILPFVFFLGNPVINHFWVRKDSLIILFFILIIFFSIKKSNKYLVIVNLLLIIGLLIHEAIGFFCFPILFLIVINKNLFNTGSLAKSILISIFQIVPSIFTFLSVLYFKGSQLISSQIWNSWKSVAFPIQADNDKIIPAAINALSWSLSRGLSLAVDTMKNFNDNIYAPLAWFIILLLIYYLLTNTDKLNFRILYYRPNMNFNKNTISNILIFQFITIVPLFLLGWDYGRWVFFWVTSSFAIILLVPEKVLSILFPKILSSFGENVNDILDSLLSNSKEFLILLCLLIGFSSYSWQLKSTVNSNSLIIITKFISKCLKFILIALRDHLQ